MKIPFNKPFIIGKETEYIREAVLSGKISGDGMFTKKCHAFFEERYGFRKVLLTTSCTDALEMCAILSNIEPGDEVIAPAYTFVSTVNAFVLRGAKIVFADSHADQPNIDENAIEKLITKKTKAIIPVHYAGTACNMDAIMSIAKKKKLIVIEDAAQAIDSSYKGKPLGAIGDMAAFSFHETKNIIAGEGGLITINNPKFVKRAEIIREKGTNRSAFFRGEVNKYGWVDIGSSFLPSEIIAAFLYAQLEHLDTIQEKRKKIWDYYYKELKPLEDKEQLRLPVIPDYATNNAHMFYVVCRNLKERTALIEHLRNNEILSVFHYLSLHKSPYYKKFHDGRKMPNSDMFTDCLLRLPLYYELNEKDLKKITGTIKSFFKK
jgi:dTDP-4-amino-4,6-dideoxygalactose transaminase